MLTARLIDRDQVLCDGYRSVWTARGERGAGVVGKRSSVGEY